MRSLSRRLAVGMIGTTLALAGAVVAVSSAPASAVITGNVMSGTASSMWQTNNEVDVLVAGNGIVYAGGKFTSVRPPGTAANSTQAVTRNYLAAFNANTGALLTTFNANLNNRVTALELSPDGTRLYVGGSFTTVGGTTRNRLAALNPTTGALITAFNPNPNKSVTSIAATNSTVYLGGDFSTVKGVAQANIASVSATNGNVNTAFNPVLTTWPPQGTTTFSPRVDALEVATDGTRVFAGGSFNNVDAASPVTGGFVSLDPTSGDVQPWAASASPPAGQPINTNCTGRVTDVIVDGDFVYVTGEGDPPGCYEGTYKARVSTGEMLWNAECLGASQALALAGGVLYKGSHQHDCAFTQGGPFGGFVGGIGRDTFVHRYLVGQDTSDGSFVHWYPNTNATAMGGTTSVGPQAMASDGTQVFVGGDFTTVNGSSQSGLARFSPNGDTATPQVPGRSYNADPWPDTDPIQIMKMPVTVTPTAAGTLTVEFPAVIDVDTGNLTYRVYRDGSNTAFRTLTARSWPWTHPVLRLDDTGLTPGSTHSYRVDATDGIHTSAKSTAVSGTVISGSPASLSDVYSGSNPQAWWRLGESSGTAAADSSASGANPGTYRPGATPGQPGVVSSDSGVSLDGVNGYVSSDNTVNTPNSFTESVWFRTTTTDGGVIMAQTTSADGTAAAGTDRLLAMDNNGGIVLGVGRTAVRNQGPVFNDGNWHNAVATYDSTTQTANVYVDGWLNSSLVFTRTPAALAPSYVQLGYANTNNIQLVFGRNYYNNHWPRSDHFKGSIDEAAVYDRVFTQAEAQAQFAAGMADADNTPLPSAPVADFTSTTSQLTASFTNASTDADNDISSYAWSFGDGATPGTSDQASPSYTYGAAGTYDVTLTVTDGGGRTNSVTKPVTVSDAAPTQTTVIDNAQPWRYRYVAGAPPAGWNTRLFDSSTWSLGNAVLGFGNASVATNINTFANTTDRPLTAYFNKSFDVTDASKAVSLELTTVANDGVVIYVNGTEVGRSNMPTGTVAYNTYASSARNTATANANPVVVNVPVSLLVNGTNTVSAETHLNYRATTDVTFDLKAELTANG